MTNAEADAISAAATSNKNAYVFTVTADLALAVLTGLGDVGAAVADGNG